MGEPDLYWFRTRQDLLEEWGYAQSVWHLVRRTAAFITVIALDVHGRPPPSGDLSNECGCLTVEAVPLWN